MYIYIYLFSASGKPKITKMLFSKNTIIVEWTGVPGSTKDSLLLIEPNNQQSRYTPYLSNNSYTVTNALQYPSYSFTVSHDGQQSNRTQFTTRKYISFFDFVL